MWLSCTFVCFIYTYIFNEHKLDGIFYNWVNTNPAAYQTEDL